MMVLDTLAWPGDDGGCASSLVRAHGGHGIARKTKANEGNRSRVYRGGAGQTYPPGGTTVAAQPSGFVGDGGLGRHVPRAAEQGKKSLASRHQSSQRNFIMCKAHRVAFPSILTHKSIPYVEGLDLPTHPALGQICAGKPMSQQGLHPSKNRLMPSLMNIHRVKVQAIMKFEPSLTKSGRGVLTLGSLYSAVKEGSLPKLHVTDQLGCWKV